MADNTPNVVVDRRALIEAVRELNTLAVSLDRLGSFYADKSVRDREEALALFARDWDLFGRLSRARRILHEALTDAVASEEMEDELERALDDTPYWAPE
jgi:hypothetical protein